jgi:hypothetical protein
VLRAAAVVVAAAALAGCGGAGDDGADATEALVLEACAPGRDPLEVQVCRCAYRELSERLDAEELEQIDQQLRDDPEDVPEVVQEAALACAFEPVAVPPPPTTTTSTSTTTAPRQNRG